MTTPDHLHPARPEYLRRGTPVVWSAHECTVVDADDAGTHDGAMLRLDCSEWGSNPEGHWMPLVECFVDLRDPTARAHAAWAWTCSADRYKALCALVGTRKSPELWALQQMAKGRPVTPAEARNALLWAEAVVLWAESAVSP